MAAFRHQKSPSSDRFLGLFSKPTDTPSAAGGELDEGEVFWSGTDFASQDAASPSAAAVPAASAGRSSPATLSPSGSFRRSQEKNFGILAALPEDDQKPAVRNPSFLQRKTSISSSSSTSTSPNSSSVRMIPAIPKRKQDYSSFSMPAAGRIYQQSAPVNVPMAPRRARRRGFGEEEADASDQDDPEDDEMLPPHEIVARASAKDSPMTTFSVLEGVGRTLKGRDLRQVRNAVWRQTGFLD